MDRISNLPDEILYQILSFFPTKEAASTSVLSKRWRNLFAFIPDLCICYVDYNFFNRRTKLYRSFTDFVDRLLAVSGNSPVRKLTLTIRQSVESAHINRWMVNVLSRGILVLDLDLDANTEDVISLPLEIFTCKTLVTLKLGRLICIAKVPKNASLPALKTLFLRSMSFSGGAFEALLSACHVLEELSILGHHDWDWRQFQIISCPTLKRLALSCTSYWGSDAPRSLTFDTPRLAYLDFHDYLGSKYPNINLDSLVEAKISLNSTRRHDERNLENLIKGLRNVEILDLSTLETSKIFCLFAEAIPLFKNLNHLSVATASKSCGKLVPILLEKSPNLDTLVIKGPLHFHDEYDKESEYSFLSSSTVKVVEITKYSGTKGELEQMKHFLEKLICLELVKVWSSERGRKEQLRLTNDLLRLPRPSEGKILFEFIPPS